MPLSIELIYSHLMKRSDHDLKRKLYIGSVCSFTLILSFLMYVIAGQVGDTTCEKSLTVPIVSISAVLILFSLITLVGLCFKTCLKPLFWVFMVVMSVALVLFVIVLVFLIIVFTSDADWLRKRFVDDHNRWNSIKACFIQNNFCANIYTVYGTTPTLDELRVMPLSTIQSGCCKPAYECNFEYVSPVEWVKPDGLLNFTNPDCQLWRNDPSSFCFDCVSCKDGFIHKLKYRWHVQSVRLVSMLGPILETYCIGWIVLLVCWPREKKD